jgi:Fic family protein
MNGVRGGRATPGAFRAIQNYIAPPGAAFVQARYVPPPPLQMHDALLALEHYTQAPHDFPPLVRLALIHYQFEAIHPFVDGNGRTGRLLISLLLGQWNLLPLPLLYLSAYFERQRSAYYDLLLAVSERGAWTDWVRFFLAGVSEQARDAIRRARKLQDLREGWHQLLYEERAPGSMHQLVDLLSRIPVITAPQAAEHLHLSRPTVRASLERLMALRILRGGPRTAYGQVYLAEDILDAVRDSEL